MDYYRGQESGWSWKAKVTTHTSVSAVEKVTHCLGGSDDWTPRGEREAEDLFLLEHLVDGAALAEIKMLGIGAPFGSKTKSALLKMLQKKYSQPGGCESTADRRWVAGGKRKH